MDSNDAMMLHEALMQIVVELRQISSAINRANSKIKILTPDKPVDISEEGVTWEMET